MIHASSKGRTARSCAEIQAPQAFSPSRRIRPTPLLHILHYTLGFEVWETFPCRLSGVEPVPELLTDNSGVVSTR